jgi:plastocyanin
LTAAIAVGKSQQFRAHVFLNTNPAVTWYVNNVAGGDATYGTIDFTGLYTAPASLPANPNLVVTATSQADPTKSASVAARTVAEVLVAPASEGVHVGDTVQFTAAVHGVVNPSVNWAVDGVVGGSATLGTITGAGLYLAPLSVPSPGWVSITATSIADPSAPGVANLVVYPARMLTLFPATAEVLPGNKLNFQYHTNVYHTASRSSYGPVVNWLVNGMPGGSATTGTITNYGQYTAPPVAHISPQTVTVTAVSAVNPLYSASSTVTIAAPAGQGASASLLDTWTKVRPYDIVAGAPSLQIAAAQQEYASWQVLLTGTNEDLTGVDVQVSDFQGSQGGVIHSSEATIYLEKYVNASKPSRLQWGDSGEWPDPLVPKVDPFVHETRNAFPFSVQRVSPAYRIHGVSASGDTTNAGLGAGTAHSSGAYTGSVFQKFEILVDSPGAAGTATFKWSTDGGVTFHQTGVRTSTTPVALMNGVNVSFQAGNVSGVSDFNLGDQFWIFAGPLRNQPVWIDLYVPKGTLAGNYTGTVTVAQAGKPSTALAVVLEVYNFAIPVSSSIPSYWGAYWPGYVQAHFLIPSGSQMTALGQLYGTACLINRISCDTNVRPQFSYNANGTLSGSNYTSFDHTLGPLADGTITPHGERLTSINQRLVGGDDTQKYFTTRDQLAHALAKGWRNQMFDYTIDEPHGSAAFLALMDRASLMRSADNTFRTLVTTDIANSNGNLEGYVSRFTPNWMSLGQKIFLAGPSSKARAFYDDAVRKGADIWWYDSCVSHGCSNLGGVPQQDNYPNSMMDTSAVMIRIWGFMGLVPYRVSGVLYYETSHAYGQYYFMSPPRIDVWDSIYYFGGNGDGTFFYPGRPAQIGGTTDIPIESLRLKYIRDALVDMEYGRKLQAQGDGAFLDSRFLQVASDLYTYDPNPAAWSALRKTLGQKIK